MWTSYAALCELGMATLNDPSVDPANVFGVVPSNLQQIPQSKGGYGSEFAYNGTSGNTYDEKQNENNTHYGQYESRTRVENQEFLQRIREMGDDTKSPFHIKNASPIINAEGEMYQHSFAGGGGPMMTSHKNQQSFIPHTPYSRNLTSNYQHGDQMHDDSTSAVHATSLFPQTAVSTGSSVPGDGFRRGHLPSTALFATPGLTPIPHNEQQQQYSTMSINNSSMDVFSRARQVAGRSYYQPSPEMHSPMPFNNTNMISVSRHDNGRASTPPSSYTRNTKFASSIKTARRRQFKRRTDHLLAVEESKHDEYSLEQRSLFDGGNSARGRNLEEEMEITREKVLVDDDENITEKVENKVRVNGGNVKAISASLMQRDAVESDEGIRHILELFCTLGAAQRMLSAYHCKDAIGIYRSLPNNQYNTGFVQHQVGRAYFEMADYTNAQRALETMQRAESYR